MKDEYWLSKNNEGLDERLDLDSKSKFTLSKFRKSKLTRFIVQFLSIISLGYWAS